MIVTLILVVTQHLMLIEVVKLLVVVDMALQIDYVGIRKDRKLKNNRKMTPDNLLSQPSLRFLVKGVTWFHG